MKARLPLQRPVQLDVSAQPTMAAVCPTVPACSAQAPAVLLTLLGWRIRTAGPATMAGGTLPGAGLTPCCGGCVRDCWLFSKDSRRAGRLFCWRTERESKSSQGFKDMHLQNEKLGGKIPNHLAQCCYLRGFKAVPTMDETCPSQLLWRPHSMDNRGPFIAECSCTFLNWHKGIWRKLNLIARHFTD